MSIGMERESSGESKVIKEMSHMMKRKAQYNAAEKNNQTPLKNKQEAEFSAEFTQGEDPAKGKNRNSSKGMKGRS
jgi:hypothetical protein